MRASCLFPCLQVKLNPEEEEELRATRRSLAEINSAAQLSFRRKPGARTEVTAESREKSSPCDTMAQERHRPRLCHIKRGEQGYGFHLHGEKGKSGQFIRKVEPGSSAEAAGLKAGDRVLEVNGENVEKETHHQVVQRIKAIENETRLLVVDREADEHLKKSPPRSRTESQPNSSAPSTPTTGSNNNGEVWKTKEDTSHEDQLHNNHSTENGKQDMNGQVKERCPRLCYLKKSPGGYGFNLHSEKSRPGQFIRSVDPGSPAAKAGLRPQDRLVEVNGQNIENMKHSEVVANIKSKDNETKLLVIDPETDDYFKKLGITPTEAHFKGTIPLTNGMTPTQLNGDSSTSSSHSDLQSPDKDSQAGDLIRRDPFEESGLRLSPTAAEAKEKARAKRANKRAPQMDWSKKHEIFSNF
ncbi:Na(+)/H(+) exchange regulatory cofactor NHE-RF2 isoform X2 [Xenopus laevis]|uniref:Na(+)/H(+) exchange regulatory cofactor NHE-RF2 isoform X2 n=1 Tax=Xenopus laevis TaxID=8355 RepID=A0A8J1LUV4_XENLA|nr:Na(+)/H(+) exchange regulatory cofactor NHE-RF2 isoform X2 [Xenopus laevis]